MDKSYKRDLTARHWFADLWYAIRKDRRDNKTRPYEWYTNKMVYTVDGRSLIESLVRMCFVYSHTQDWMKPLHTLNREQIEARKLGVKMAMVYSNHPVSSVFE